MKTTSYYDFSVRRRRPEIKDEWVEKALQAPEFAEVQTKEAVNAFSLR